MVSSRSFYFEVYVYLVVWFLGILLLALFGDVIGSYLLVNGFFVNNCNLTNTKVASIFLGLALLVLIVVLWCLFLLRYSSKLFDLYFRLRKISFFSRWLGFVLAVGLFSLFAHMNFQDLNGICMKDSLRYGSSSSFKIIDAIVFLGVGFMGFMVMPVFVYVLFTIAKIFKINLADK